MDRFAYPRWAFAALSAGAMGLAGCGAGSAPPDATYADLPGVTSFTAASSGANPSRTQYAIPRAPISHEPAAEPVAIVPVSDNGGMPQVDSGVPRSASISDSLPESPPALDLSALKVPGQPPAAAGANVEAPAPAIPAAAGPSASQPAGAAPTTSDSPAAGPRLAPAAADAAKTSAASRQSVLIRHGSPDIEPERGILPWAKVRGRSRDLDVVAAQSMRLSREAFQLADRGASHSARRKFIEALRQVALALDVEQQTTMYSNSLSAGLTALRESSDFVGRASLEQVDVKYAAATHKTPILKNSTQYPVGTVALQQYYTYAQEQLAAAAGQEAAGSLALYGLGRVALGPRRQRSAKQEQISHAAVFHQAALLADRRNFLAANELAVLLADSGRLELARSLLTQSLAVAPQADVWQNLAVVHARLGQRDLAARAQNQAVAIGRGRSVGPVSAHVLWVDPTTFARSQSVSEGLHVPIAAAKPAPAATTGVRSGQAQAAGRSAPSRMSANAPAAKTGVTGSPAEPKSASGISAWLPWNKPTRR